jgi:hypothetical protein
VGLLYEPDSDAGRESSGCEDWRRLGISGKAFLEFLCELLMRIQFKSEFAAHSRA